MRVSFITQERFLFTVRTDKQGLDFPIATYLGMGGFFVQRRLFVKEEDRRLCLMNGVELGKKWFSDRLCHEYRKNEKFWQKYKLLKDASKTKLLINEKQEIIKAKGKIKSDGALSLMP